MLDSCQLFELQLHQENWQWRPVRHRLRLATVCQRLPNSQHLRTGARFDFDRKSVRPNSGVETIEQYGPVWFRRA